MRLHRFIGEFNLNNDIVGISDEDVVNQLKNVFRFSKGDNLILCDGANNEALGEIVEIDKKGVEVKILERSVNDKKPKNISILYCALLKKENFEWVVEKAVECGISEIAPIITERTVKLNLNMDRVHKIIKEAAEQSDRGTLPKIHEPVKFEKAIQDTPSNILNLFFEESGEKNTLEVLANNKHPQVAAWIGPEGGWTESEIELAKQSKFQITTLGKATLRGETAAIVASYLISNI